MIKVALISLIFFSQTPTTNLEIKEHNLSNGLKVLFLETHAAPVVTVQVWFRVGSKNEPEGLRGISHLLEHMMFRGSDNVGSEEHMRQVSAVGGRSNAYTSEDVTVYHETLPSSELELAFRLEAERMAHLNLTEPSLKTEREVVKEELRVGIENSPFGAMYARLLRILYKVHPYCCHVIGTIEDLNRTTADDLKNYYEKYYAPDNAVLIVVGDASWEDVLGLANKYFGSITKKHGVIGQVPQEPIQTKENKLSFKYPMQMPVVGFAYHLPGAADPDIPALEVAINVLVRGRSSRLYKRLVREEKLAFRIGDVTEIMHDPGFFAAYAVFPRIDETKRLEKILLEEIDKVGKQGITFDELTAAKNRLLANFTFSLYSVNSQAYQIGHAHFYQGDYRKFLNRRERYSQLTLEDVKVVAQKYFKPANRTRFLVEPEVKDKK